MDEIIYYVESRTAPYSHDPDWFWKISKRVARGISEVTQTAPGMSATIALTDDLDVCIPDSEGYEQYRRTTRDAFHKRWNETFDTLQKARLHGGEYYIERSASGVYFNFHAFLRDPSRHYKISL